MVNYKIVFNLNSTKKNYLKTFKYEISDNTKLKGLKEVIKNINNSYKICNLVLILFLYLLLFRQFTYQKIYNLSPEKVGKRLY